MTNPAQLIVRVLMATTLVTVIIAFAAKESETETTSDPVRVESLRGPTPIDEEGKPPPVAKYPKQTDPYPMQYVGQPPPIPHSIRGYEITANSNKCMMCHSWQNSVRMKAPKIGISHYMDRDGNVLADVAPSRYNCTQCHVVQANAKPLVPNTFSPVDSLKKQ
ncbi:nitrate reductase cytochrome c-type subunit [Endozoicomonadaceae bacterium StTr2]